MSIVFKIYMRTNPTIIGTNIRQLSDLCIYFL
nr:MAG TPA: hypothetical protein [Caudoviricetes sp.]